MIFKKVNIMDELAVLEHSQTILDDRFKQKQIDPQVYIEKSLELKAKIEKLRQEKFNKETNNF